MRAQYLSPSFALSDRSYCSPQNLFFCCLLSEMEWSLFVAESCSLVELPALETFFLQKPAVAGKVSREPLDRLNNASCGLINSPRVSW